MNKPAEGWHITRHAHEQALERGVTEEELWRAILHPQTVLPSTRGDAVYRISGGVIAVCVDHHVVTTQLDGASREDWSDHVRTRPAIPTPVPAVTSTPAAAARRTPRRSSGARSGPVHRTHVLDGVCEEVRDYVTDMVARHGGDWSRVQRISATEVIVR